MYGKRIDRMCLIIDLKGTNLSSMFDSTIRSYKKKGFGVGSDFYPEILGRTWIINAPWLFTAIWSIVKIWLDPVTLKKISIHGSSYKKAL